MAKATKTIRLDIDGDKADLLQAAADQRGRTISDLMESGESIQGLVNDQLNQAMWRLASKGVYPAEMVAEAKAEAARVVAARIAAGAQA